MDEKRPKRRKDKYNPYDLSIKDGCYYLYFKDGEGSSHYYEIDKPLYDLLDSFELDDLAYLNEVDRHIEQSVLSEMAINKRAVQDVRAVQRMSSVEDAVIDASQRELLHTLIARLPEVQQRRVRLYFFAGLTYEQIATLEGCKYPAIIKSVRTALKKIKKIFERGLHFGF